MGSLATLLWAIVLNRNAHVCGDTWESWLGRRAKIVGVTVLAGPASAAVLLIWERDELILGALGEGVEKKISWSSS